MPHITKHFPAYRPYTWSSSVPHFHVLQGQLHLLLRSRQAGARLRPRDLCRKVWFTLCISDLWYNHSISDPIHAPHHKTFSCISPIYMIVICASFPCIAGPTAPAAPVTSSRSASSTTRSLPKGLIYIVYFWSLIQSRYFWSDSCRTAYLRDILIIIHS